MVRRGLLLGLAVMALVVLALATLSGAVDGRRARALTPAHTGEELAALRVLGDGVEVRPAGTDAWVAASDGRGLVAGDALRAAAAASRGPTGAEADGPRAEVLHLDGSRTRLGPGAEVVVERLEGDALAPLVRVAVVAGATWHRVQRVTGERGAYEVVARGATLTARGGGFEVACPPDGACRVAVVDGHVLVGDEDDVTVLDEDEELALEELGTPDAVRERPAGVLAIRSFASANLGRDRTTGRFGPADEACAVTVDGRNADLADSPATAIRAGVGERLVVDALAVGPLEAYAVRLRTGLLELPAARGEVRPGPDATRFRGTVALGDQARWGVGLYAVTATTTGTACRVTTWVDVRGGSPVAPLLAVPGAAATVLGVVGVALLASALDGGGASTPRVARRRRPGAAPSGRWRGRRRRGRG